MNATSKLRAGLFTLVLAAFAQEQPPVTVEVPSQQTQVTVENFNFVRHLAGRWL